MRLAFVSKRFLILLLCVTYSCLVFAQSEHTYHKSIPDLPAVPRLVNDLADMLNEQEETLLEAKLLAFEKESSNEVTIVTVETLGDMEVSEFALELGRKWNIGKKEKKNGVLILASKQDRKINISPGYGLQGALTDMICSRIIREYMKPQFKAGNFYAGFDDASKAIIKATKGEFTNDAKDEQKSVNPFPFALIIIFLVLVFYIFFIRRNKNFTYVSRKGYNYDRGAPWLGGFGGFGGGSGWGNSGGGSSGGGFGGFGGGGGGFDGGGASGDW
ncbi:MAG: TPM domain-containing protein [Bacteroidetes bacterium]|nr:TPM domain-containing protein [Bacteroidota bacterium]